MIINTLESNNNSKSKEFWKDKKKDFKSTNSHFSSSSNSPCIFCKESHSIYKCSSFLKLTPQDRSKQIRNLKACTNCLKSLDSFEGGHSSNSCSSGSCHKFFSFFFSFFYHVTFHWQFSSLQNYIIILCTFVPCYWT